MQCILLPVFLLMMMNQDYITTLKFLERLAPEKPHSQYRHNTYEDNADAHMKRQIMGREVVVAVTDGKLDFGPWNKSFMESLMVKE